MKHYPVSLAALHSRASLLHNTTRLATAFAILLGASPSWAQPGPGEVTAVYTLDADFTAGVLQGLNLSVPDQLMVDSGGVETFPNLWIANAGEDSVSKVDANLDQEIARYRTWFPTGSHGSWSGPAPSRTAVDGDGNVYVANRGFGGYAGRDEYAYVIKILSSGGIDRNGNGVIDTSSDGYDGSTPDGLISASEILPVVDDNSDGVFQVAEARDERVAWVTEIPGSSSGLGRSLSIAPDGNIWVGLYNTAVYYELDGSTGAVLSGPHSVAGHNPYGSLVDRNGILWGASLSRYLLRLDTNAPGSPTILSHGGTDYALALARGASGETIVYKARAAFPFLRYNSLTGVFDDISTAGFYSYGISTDSAGNIYITGSSASGSLDGMTKFAPDGSILWGTGAQTGTNTGDNRGAVVDANGDVWGVAHPSPLVAKYDGADGTPLGTVGVGLNPYTYSDASGSSFVFTNPFGTWTFIHDTGVEDSAECKLSWTADAPGDATVVVEMDASNTGDEISDYSTASLTEVANGDMQPVAGRYMYVRVTLTPGDTAGDDPVLYDLTISCTSICGDLDGDGDVDALDRSVFLSALGTVLGDGGYLEAADYDSDGGITYNDYREWYKCYLLYRSSL